MQCITVFTNKPLITPIYPKLPTSVNTPPNIPHTVFSSVSYKTAEEQEQHNGELAGEAGHLLTHKA